MDELNNSSSSMPLVSVLIPAHNAMPDLQRCISSLLDQTYPNIEIVIVDDGSTDNTKEYLLSLKEEKIRFISIQNMGVSTARNIAIDLALGCFITFVDADDIVVPSFVEDALRFSIKNKLDIAIGGLTKVYGSKRIAFGVPIKSKMEQIFIGDAIESVISTTIAYSSKNNSFLSSFFLSGSVCKLIRRDVIGAIRFNQNLSIGEDTLFNVELLNNCTRIGLLAHNWYEYIIHADSAVGSYKPDALDRAELLISELFKATKVENRQFVYIRAVREFEGACLTSYAHKFSVDIFHLVKDIKTTLRSPFWATLFSFPNNWVSLIVEKRYKILASLCCGGHFILIACYLLIIRLLRNLK